MTKILLVLLGMAMYIPAYGPTWFVNKWIYATTSNRQTGMIYSCIFNAMYIWGAITIEQAVFGPYVTNVTILVAFITLGVVIYNIWKDSKKGYM